MSIQLRTQIWTEKRSSCCRVVQLWCRRPDAHTHVQRQIFLRVGQWTNVFDKEQWRLSVTGFLTFRCVAVILLLSFDKNVEEVAASASFDFSPAVSSTAWAKSCRAASRFWLSSVFTQMSWAWCFSTTRTAMGKRRRKVSVHIQGWLNGLSLKPSSHLDADHCSLHLLTFCLLESWFDAILSMAFSHNFSQPTLRQMTWHCDCRVACMWGRWRSKRKPGVMHQILMSEVLEYFPILFSTKKKAMLLSRWTQLLQSICSWSWTTAKHKPFWITTCQ